MHNQNPTSWYMKFNESRWKCLSYFPRKSQVNCCVIDRGSSASMSTLSTKTVCNQNEKPIFGRAGFDVERMVEVEIQMFLNFDQAPKLRRCLFFAVFETPMCFSGLTCHVLETGFHVTTAKSTSKIWSGMFFWECDITRDILAKEAGLSLNRIGIKLAICFSILFQWVKSRSSQSGQNFWF